MFARPNAQLPETIINDLLFYTIDINSARKLLNDTSPENGNFLFCRGDTNSEIYLCYRAVFKGKLECRSLKLSYNLNAECFYHSSLGEHSTIPSIIASLTKFLSGFSDSPFVPNGIFKHNASNQQAVLASNLALPPLPNDLVREKVIPLLDAQTILNAAKTSRNLHTLVKTTTLFIFKSKMDLVQSAKEARIKKISAILKNLSEKMPHDEAVADNSNHSFVYNNLTISELRQYGSSAIMCKVNCTDYHDCVIVISSSDVHAIGGKKVSDIFLDELEATSRLGVPHEAAAVRRLD